MLRSIPLRLGPPFRTTMFVSKLEVPVTEAFFRRGLVALAMPYLQPQPPMGRGAVHPHSTKMYLGDL